MMTLEKNGNLKCKKDRKMAFKNCTLKAQEVKVHTYF